MKKFLLLFLLLAPLLCAPAHAQTFDLDADRQPVASLDGLWRFHTGDNPQWASPSFDDSQWPLLRSDESWALAGLQGLSAGTAWYRFQHNTIPAGNEPTSPCRLTCHSAQIIEVYANGKLESVASVRCRPNPIPYRNCRRARSTPPDLPAQSSARHTNH